MVIERPFLGPAFLPNNCIRRLATFPPVRSVSKDAQSTEGSKIAIHACETVESAIEDQPIGRTNRW